MHWTGCRRGYCLGILILLLLFADMGKAQLSGKSASSQSTLTPDFKVAERPWTDSLGNHRLVLLVDRKGGSSDAVAVRVRWRRRDQNADKKVLIVTDSAGRQIKNIFVNHIDREDGSFLFEPISGQGKYYVYYMPWSGHKWEGGFEGDYLRHQPMADQRWLAQLGKDSVRKQMMMASNLAIEARTAFDSFYPMEVIATQKESGELTHKYKSAFLLFPEDRSHPIKMLDDLPFRWIKKGPYRTDGAQNTAFNISADQNEYYVFQVGVYASREKVRDLRINYKNAPFKLNCFNTGGIDSKGQPFFKQVDVSLGHIQPLWFGIDIPKSAKPGTYPFIVQITDGDGHTQEVRIQLKINGHLLQDRGDSEPWRLSRLRWLNSRIGIDSLNTRETAPLVADQKSGTVKAGSATVKLDTYGFPKQILIGNQQLLTAPIAFNLAQELGADASQRLPEVGKLHFTTVKPGLISWENTRENEALRIGYEGSMESDGYLRYKIVLKAKKEVHFKDISLDIPVDKQHAKYFMGMGSGKPFGRNGGYLPKSYDWKWSGPQNAYWIGDYNAGIYCKLLGASYDGPMLNLYHPAPPPSWYNNNKGGFKIRTVATQAGQTAVIASAFTSAFHLQKDSTLTFSFCLLLTPVKKLNTESQFANRYYQNYGNPYPPAEDIKAGVGVINVHHANRVNPYINYPFVRADSMRAFVDLYHQQGVKTKIYYTIRELSDQCTEIWALRSLGTEIFSDGQGGGYPWLREHLVNHYDVQWFTPIDGYEACDAAIKTSENSRWYNYYVEGLRWLVQNVGIDGLYLDDVAYDRDMLKRMRKVMDMVKPGCMIDLHSNTDFSKGPATQYTEFFPYINKLWFGENFHYEDMQPDNWMVETSGIPFGLMGDMLFSGGNPWRGLVYGMTSRDGWPTDGKLCNPKPIWEELDRFGIKNAAMHGYWEPDAAVITDNKKVLATAYSHGQKVLIALASWDSTTQHVSLKINWKTLAVTPRQVKLIARPIQDFQKEAVFEDTSTIEVAPGRGWLLELE
ncbi:hypothetical protein SAMN05192529_1136 [Arachidicoccus rhizosphaerae]|uniref:Glycoside hydrolase 123-like N-terminal domain-containing protein n=2 Tax=Arachidicoccus rhizosphaerae TaxID=551991 RepID=A0A1H4A2C2_9BACT|nr:hypothetical protein SAMN05192529_1136 [Arachidicoccus rhizosphaerae]